ncbi:MAG: C10 family peptidase [Deltaproteobacteria bacterium]|nr:C10 family peptidase [Deltaproteobacteria bacterium]
MAQKRLSGMLAAVFLAVLMLVASEAGAKPTTAAQAQTLVLNWLGLEAQPMGSPLGGQIKQVQTFTDASGSPTYYVVYLNPAGLVFLPADDLVEPIIGFVSAAISYDPSPANPLGALVSRDIPGRVLQARQVEAQDQAAKAPLAPESPQAKAQSKWAWLVNSVQSRAPSMQESPPASISDVRVAPLVQSYWWQSTVGNGTMAVFNYYTPPFKAGDPNNYLCGCIATAMGQLMRYHQYPTNGVGARTLTIRVDWVERPAQLLGGNGTGGPYDWGNMLLFPDSGINLTQQKAIGSLAFDAGVSVNMNYRSDGISTSDCYNVPWALMNVFQYSNAKYSYNNGNNIPLTNLYAMINPNLDSQLPVILGINQSGNYGHAILADGYGYDTATMYHHLKMGWPETSQDVWYNLPNFTTSRRSYDTVHTCVYNVFKDGTGEIISGRVTTAAGIPIVGAAISASGGFVATTNANGIYALAKVPSNTIYTVSVSKSGYSFSAKQVTTGLSTDNSTTTGNVWGVDFKGFLRGGAGAIQLLLLD